MPDRFISQQEPSGGRKGISKGFKMMLIVLAALLVLGGGGYVVYSTLIAPQNAPEETNQDVEIPEENANAAVNENTNANLNVNANTNLNANLNANSNANANLNGNTNAVLNSNTVSNLNANSNANLNGNGNTNTSTVSTTPLPPTKDTDGDGLTDVEETVLGTDAALPDTDGDSFIDGKQLLSSGQYAGEVYLGYDPTQAGAKLKDNAKLVTTYTNATFNYKTLYPAKWIIRPTDSTNSSVLVTPDPSTGEYFQVMVLDNPQKLSARSWYRNTNPDVSDSLVEALTVNGLDGVRSPDHNTIYLVKNDKTYVLSYNVGSKTELNYSVLFDVLVQNFSLVAAGTTTTTNTNTTSSANTNTSGTLTTY